MSPFGGVATAVGSWPGTNPREAATTIVGELGELPHLVELPARGVGADMVGRAGALLVDLCLDTTTRGYRLGSRANAAAKRAASLLREDLDALEEAWETAGLRGGGTVKIQAAGPFTLAAEVELAGGHRVLTDRGAARDIAESLAEGVARHREDVAKRLGADIVVQLDEPELPAVLAGGLTGVTGIQRVAAVPAPEVLATLDDVVAGIGGPVAVHCCGSDVPWDLMRRSAIDAVMVDAAKLTPTALDGVGEFLEAGKDLVLGLVPTAAASSGDWRSTGAPAVALVDRLGFPRALLATRIGVSPACGLAGATPVWARTALRRCRDLAEAFADDSTTW